MPKILEKKQQRWLSSLTGVLNKKDFWPLLSQQSSQLTSTDSVQSWTNPTATFKAHWWTFYILSYILTNFMCQTISWPGPVTFWSLHWFPANWENSTNPIPKKKTGIKETECDNMLILFGLYSIKSSTKTVCLSYLKNRLTQRQQETG